MSMGRSASIAELKILRALLDQPTRQHYGLELIKSAGVSSGALYPILARLEENGVVEGEWEEIDESLEGRRKRRYYRLTAKGGLRARSEIESGGESQASR
jgi:DNA-binding PadR family transcriptional regulator